MITRNGHVLVVDGSATVRAIIRKLLAQLGFNNVDEASNSAEALAKIDETNYAFVLSDWNLEPMDGRELLKLVRANKKYTNLPFIIMTGGNAINKIVQASHAGVNGLIKKPFTAELLEAKIAQIAGE